jgi:acyl-CoA dehydrogenase
MDNLFENALDELLRGLCTTKTIRALEQETNPVHPLWTELQASGFADALVPEVQNGAGLTLAQAYPLIELLGQHAMPFPVGETMLARGWLAQAQVAIPEGTLVFAQARSDAMGLITSSVRGARLAHSALVVLDQQVRLLPLTSAKLLDDVFPLDARLQWQRADWEKAPVVPMVFSLHHSQAALYAGLMAGAMLHVFNRTLKFANDRQQFGKPIGKFQAIQHQLSIMSEHVFAARMAAQMAFVGKNILFDPLRTAIAKARTSEAALEVALLSHSIHGAIGFTEEYDLQLYTRRLNLWRQTAGTESYWYDQVGAYTLSNTSLSLDVIRCATDKALGETFV